MYTIYVINSTALEGGFVIEPGQVDGPFGKNTHSDLRLHGQATPNWGGAVDENQYRMSEHFACEQKELDDYNPNTDAFDYNPASDPILPKDEADLGKGNGITTPIYGQLWFNSTTDVENLMCFTPSEGWVELTSIAEPVDPIDPISNVYTKAEMDSNFVHVTGSTMTGALNIKTNNAEAFVVKDGSGNNVMLIDPVSDTVTFSGNVLLPNMSASPITTEILNKQYIDSHYANPATANTMSGILRTHAIIDAHLETVSDVGYPFALHDAVTKEYVDDFNSGEIQADIPVGTIFPYAGGKTIQDPDPAPSGWHYCNGFSISRATYPQLYAIIGTKYGGNSTNFKVPDMMGRFALGVNTPRDPTNKVRRATAAVLGGEGNAWPRCQLIVDTIPSHTHSVDSVASSPNHSHTLTFGNAGNHSHEITQNITSAGDHSHTGYVAAPTEALCQGDNTKPVRDQTGTTSTNGAHTHTVNLAAAPNHTHLWIDSGNNGNYDDTWSVNHTHSVTSGNTGSNVNHENTPPFLTVAYIIKLD
jgi:microcystin-dependent protein